MWNAERLSVAMLGLVEAQLAILTSLVQASVDTGLTVADYQAGAIDTQLARADAATRHWLGAGASAGTAARGQAIWYRVLPK